MKKILPSLVFGATVALSIGCSDSKNNSSPSTSDVTKSTLSGTAAKGIIQQGIVTAVELDASGNEVATVGTATTDASGHYELKLGDNYTGGVVRLRISADSNTTMKCDAFDGCGGTAFGGSVSLDSNFSLDAVIKPEGDTVKAQITPLTHMAAARALSSGVVNADSVASAISEVNQIAGVNIMQNEIVDITDANSLAGATADSKQLALFNAGLADVLVAGDIQTNLDALASSFEDGMFSSSDAVTITEITSAVSEAAVAAAADTGLSAALESEIDAVEAVVAVIESETSDTGDYNPEPASNTALTEVAQAKAMLTNARTFVEQIGTNFDQPMDALDIDAQTAEAVLSEDTAAMSQLLTHVIGQVFDSLDGQVEDLAAELASPKASGYSVGIFDDAPSPNLLGTVTATISSGNEGVAISISGSLTGNVESGASRTVTLTNFKIASNILASQLTFDGTDKNLLRAMSSVNDAELSVSGTAAADALGDTPATSVTLNSVKLAVGFSSAQTITMGTSSPEQDQVLESALSAASFVGNMSISANGATFNGLVELELAGLNIGSENPLSLKKIALNGDFTSARGAFSAGASLVIDNATSFDTFAFMDYDEELDLNFSFALEEELPPNDVQIVEAAIADVVTFGWGGTLSYSVLLFSSEYGYYLEVGLDNGYSTNVQLSGMSSYFETLINAEVSARLGATPSDVHVWYSYFDLSTGEAMVYSTAFFPPFEDASNFVKGTLTFTTTANAPGLEEAGVVASVNRTALNGGSISVTVTQGGQSFKLETTVVDTEAETINGTLTLTNPDGAKLVLNLTEGLTGDTYAWSGTASVNGVQVGEVSETDNGLTLIHYNDGSFESIF